MWRFEHTAIVNASKQVVWQWLGDAERWPLWDTDLSEAALLGELAVGTAGRMKVADDALISFVVSEVIPEERLAIQISLFGATLTYTYVIAEEENGLKLIHGAEISGIFGIFWRLMLRNKIKKTVGPALDSFAIQVTEASIAQAPAPVAEVATQEAATEGVAAQAVTAPEKNMGDPVENELRNKDIHTQIEVAAQAPALSALPAPDDVAAPVADQAPAAVQTSEEEKT